MMVRKYCGRNVTVQICTLGLLVNLDIQGLIMKSIPESALK